MNQELNRIKKFIEYNVQDVMNHYDGDASFYCDCAVHSNLFDEYVQVELRLRVWSQKVAECHYIFKKDRTDKIVGDYNIIKMIVNNFYRQLVDAQIEHIKLVKGV